MEPFYQVGEFSPGEAEEAVGSYSLIVKLREGKTIYACDLVSVLGCCHAKPGGIPYWCRGCCHAAITLRKVRRVDKWQDKVQNIVSQCVQNKHKTLRSFGSSRGFFTFIYRELCEDVIRTIIREIWAPEVLRGFAHIWLDHHYKPGGKGFREVAENTRVGKKTT